MKRICTNCAEEKELEKFVKSGLLYRYKCKDCCNAERRTGKPRGGFPKGNIPWNKGKESTEEHRINLSLSHKGQKAWNKGSAPESKQGHLSKEWNRKVKERDEWQCKKCGTLKFLQAHHIIPWKVDRSKRFALENGMTLCNSCHRKLEGFQKGHKLCLGRKITEEHRENLRKSHRGKPSPNKGKRMSKESIEKMKKTKKERFLKKSQIVAVDGDITKVKHACE